MHVLLEGRSLVTATISLSKTNEKLVLLLGTAVLRVSADSIVPSDQQAIAAVASEADNAFEAGMQLEQDLFR
jgi:hypothetical protein